MCALSNFRYPRALVRFMTVNNSAICFIYGIIVVVYQNSKSFFNDGGQSIIGLNRVKVTFGILDTAVNTDSAGAFKAK